MPRRALPALTIFLVCAGLLLADGAAARVPAPPSLGAARAALSLTNARLELMREVMASKWLSRTPIQDLAQEATVKGAAVEAAGELGVSGAGVRRLFGAEIAAAKEVELGWGSHWLYFGAPPELAAPELIQLRARLSALSERIVAVLPGLTSLAAVPGARSRVARAAARILSVKYLGAAGRAAIVEGLLAIRSSAAPLPDLVIGRGATPPVAASVGDRLSTKVVVRNRGAGAAGRSRVALYLARKARHSAKDIRLDAATTRPLPVGSGDVASLTAKLPPVAPGSYRLIACADDGNTVAESNEANNCSASVAFAVGNPERVLIGVRGAYEGPNPAPETAEEAHFEFVYSASSGGALEEPVVTFTLPKNARLVSVTLGGSRIECVGPAGRQLVCEPPSGTGDPETKLVLTVIPFQESIGEPLTLEGYVEAREAVRSATLTINSPAVEPG